MQRYTFFLIYVPFSIIFPIFAWKKTLLRMKDEGRKATGRRVSGNGMKADSQRPTAVSEADALRRLAALCSRGEHCSGEMLAKMRAWGVEEEAQSRVLKRLVENRFVDDERFARLFVSDKIKFSKWGRRKIEQALWAKHMDENIARRVLDEVDDADYLAVLRPLIQQKARSIKAESEYERRGKLTKFALGRGFTMDIIRQVVGDCED